MWRRKHGVALGLLAALVVTNVSWFLYITNIPTFLPQHLQRHQHPLKVDLNPLPELAPRPDSIFFVETSGRSSFGPKELCSVESAAKNNPDQNVYVVMTRKDIDSSNNRLISSVRDVYDNVHFKHVDVDSFVSDSALGTLWAEGKIQKSSFLVSHLSDVLRFLLLNRFGGTYLDMDQIVLRKLPETPNYLGRESIWIAAGVMRFQRDHPILTEFLREMSSSFDGTDWGSNGPMLVSRVLLRVCKTETLDELTPQKCLGIEVMPSVNFYPIPWMSWQRLFDEGAKSEVPNEIAHSYSVHIWGRHSRDAPFDGEHAYADLATIHCPVVVAAAAATASAASAESESADG